MDITLRQSVDDAPRAGHGRAVDAELLAAALDAAASPALVLERGGAVAFANRAFLHETGRALPELVGRLPPFAEGVACVELREAVRAGRRWSGPVRVSSGGGEPLERELVASPVPSRGGEPAHVVALLRERGTQHPAEAHLLLTDRLVSVGALAAGVSQEVSSPLAFLLTNLQYASDTLAELAERLPDSAARLDDVRTAVAEASEGAERVRDIMAELRALARPQDRVSGPVEVEQVLETALGMAWSQIRGRARLVRAYGRVPQVSGDASRLAQAFLNVLLNAAQAVPEGQVSAHEIRVATRAEPGGRVVVEVSDTGAGMDAQVNARAFEPFFTTKSSAVGLGLYVVRQVVGSMGGEIHLESELGRGTLVRITLPEAERVPNASLEKAIPLGAVVGKSRPG